MIPSLAARDLRDAITEYLSTTFAIGDAATRAALDGFLENEGEGLFRGPFLRLRMPFRSAEVGWRSPLGWLPDGFAPYEHQAAAFDRLTSVGQDPEPTLVVTGTGSGKTEAFLYPILDHCRRHADEPGVKALLLYPMNALAFDQAGRLARLLAEQEALSGVTAGLYVGGDGSHSEPTADGLVDRRRALRDDPPDILLTNYRMLDFLLLRGEDAALWASNGSETLRYVVLDEFHTYDGAQGTDVAMLLRRLGARLGMATPDCPLGTAAPVATSATLGEQGASGEAMREFAGRVFGVAFPAEAVIGERRQSISEATGAVDYELPIPEVDDVLAVASDDDEALAALFTDTQTSPGGLDPLELGRRLLPHPLTSGVLRAVAERSTDRRRALDVVVSHAPHWGRAAQQDPARVEEALARFLSLLSQARRQDPNRPGGAPLFVVEVQLWVRELSRLLRELTPQPRFRWLDGGGPDDEAAEVAALPAIYCRQCGRTGWMSVAGELDGSLSDAASTIYQAAVHHSRQQRALIHADADEADVVHLDPRGRSLLGAPADGSIPVLATADEDAAGRQTCPSCGEANGIRFLGARVATLASVAITTYFGSTLIEPEERKLLAFTDSVQDASHRASFFAARTYRFNLRTALSQAVAEAGHVTVAELGDRVLATAEALEDPSVGRHALVPADLLADPEVRRVWTDDPSAVGQRRLAERLAFETHLELGLRSRLGRTLELTGTAVAAVNPGDVDHLAAVLAEDHANLPGQPRLLDDADHAGYLHGLLERLRLRGAIFHRWLDRYVADDGRAWHIWGGRPDGMPAFPEGHGRPTFVTTGSGRNFDGLTRRGATPTWLADWAARTLGTDPADAVTINSRAFALLAGEGVIDQRRTSAGDTVYGLDPARIDVVDIPDRAAAPQVRCRLCTHLLPVPPGQAASWTDRPCMRYRCRGRYEPAPADPGNYYRRLYRSGRMRRVVSGEHTGLLDRDEREALEGAFKAGATPDAPNVLACTPTLELGIDIGDLSAVLLTSVPTTPASYIQRVGRAGRASGNALAVTFAPADPHSLYYLATPEHMLAGEVHPPSCYLDAEEILARQYLAYLIDRAAVGELPAPAMPHQIGPVAERGLDEGGWLRAILDANALDGQRHAAAFLELFSGHVSAETRERLHRFAAEGLDHAVKTAVERWTARHQELRRRRDRLKARVDELDSQTHREEDDEQELRRLRGERAAAWKMIKAAREEYTLTALTRLGLLPNYALLDDAVTLDAQLWWRTEDGEYDAERREYQRSAAVAITELAPGNSFYAGGHRLVIDALEIGSASEPLYEQWRLCPDCAYGGAEDQRVDWSACPRCHSTAISDAGASHTLLALREVSCADSEERARVYDDSDERDRGRYATVTSVDVDPAAVAHAWKRDGAVFGVELASNAVIRSLNLGPVDKPGEEIALAGRTRRASRFRTCRYCGGVDGARPDARTAHRGWCLTRSGRKEVWDTPLLFHELHTEAVRILLPLSDFEVAERLATFKAALLLGLRLNFGGDPRHLRVITADAPGGSSASSRRRFLVLHDTIPGGTGYLGRLADPDRLGALLDQARTAIARCPCRDEGRVACHRCLLSAVDRDEIELVSRPLALELLDELLDNWSFEPVPTIADVAIGGVEESELERKFRAALAVWAEADERVTLTTRPGGGARGDLELRLSTDDGATRRYLLREQAPVSDAQPATTPDVLIVRQDAPGPDVAVYLDGYAYHAAAAAGRTGDDARKRDGVRATGRRVWSLTWEDVEDFDAAARSRVAKQAADRALLTPAARRVAEQIHHHQGGRFDVAVAERNPVRQLLDYLAAPDPDDWDRLARSIVGGLAREGDPSRLTAEEVRGWLAGFAAGNPPEVDAAGDWHAWSWRTEAGLDVALVLDAAKGDGANAERWTALTVLDDTDAAAEDPAHKTRWRDWLQLANVLQHLGASPDRAPAAATAWTRVGAGELDLDAFDAVPVAAAEAAETPGPFTAGGLDAETAAELAYADPAVRELLEQAIALGAAAPEIGHEPEGVGGQAGWQVEAAWPDAKVALLVDDESARDRWLAEAGWQVRRADEWTAEDLAAVTGKQC